MKIRRIIYTLIFIAFFANLSSAQLKPKLTLVHDDGFDSINYVTFSPDGTKFLSCTVNGILWDIKSGERLLTLPGGGISCAAFTPDGLRIAGGRDHLLKRIWDSKTGELLYQHQGAPDPRGPVGIKSITFTPKEDRVLYIDEHGSLNKWDYRTDNIQNIVDTHSRPSSDIQFFDDKDRILINSRVISLSQKKILHLFEYSAGSMINNVNQVVTLKRTDGSYRRYRTILWNSEVYEKISENSVYESRSNINKISPDGKFIAVGRTENSPENTRIIDARTAAVQRQIHDAKDETPNIGRIVFSPDGKQVAFTSGNTINIYDISDLTSGVQNAEQLKQ